MAIEFVASTVVDTSPSSSNKSMSLAASGDNRMMIVVVVCWTAVTFTVTCGGVSMSLAASALGTSGSYGVARTYIYILYNPASGTNGIVIDPSGYANFGGFAISLSGCNQSSTPDASNSSIGTTGGVQSTIVTTVANNCWVVGGCTMRSSQSTATLSTTLTSRRAIADGSRYARLADTNGPITPAGEFTVPFTLDDSGKVFAIAAISIAPVATGGSIVPLAMNSYRRMRV